MLVVLGVAVVLLIGGCSGGGGSGKQGGGGGGPSATIVSDLPLQGSARAQQETVANAIQLALEQRNNMAGDVEIKYVSQDDATAQAGKWDEAKCAENAQTAAQDEKIVGWIGPYNSGCAAVQIPILNQGGLRERTCRPVPAERRSTRDTGLRTRGHRWHGIQLPLPYG